MAAGGAGPTLDARRQREMDKEGGPSMIEGPASREWETLKMVRLTIAELPTQTQVLVYERARELRRLTDSDEIGGFALALVGAERAAEPPTQGDGQ